MKERMKRLVHIIGSTAALTIILSIPVHAQENQTPAAQEAFKQEAVQGKESAQAEESKLTLLDADTWADKAAASVMTCANVRSEPTIESERLGILPRAGVATVVETGDTWTKVQSGEITGYIRNDLLVFGQAAKELYEKTYGITGTVTAASLRVRADASLEAAQIDVVQAGEKVILTGKKGDWYAVKRPGDKIAYTYAQYITIDETRPVAVPVQAAEKPAEVQPAAPAETQPAAPAETQPAAPAEAQPAAPAEAQPAAPAETQPAAPAEAPPEAAPASAAADGELALLAAIIQCEAGGESYEGKVAVGAVVLNRVRSGSFPDSITDVIYQSGQFSPVASGGLDQVLASGARGDCYEAAQAALNGENPVGDSLYFNSGSGRGIQIGNQHFY